MDDNLTPLHTRRARQLAIELLDIQLGSVEDAILLVEDMIPDSLRDEVIEWIKKFGDDEQTR